MSNIVQRSLERSLAKSVSEVEKETGIPASELTEIMNTEYGYVPQNDKKKVNALKKQVELDIAAQQHSQENKLNVNKVAVVKTAIDRNVGTLTEKYKKEEPNTGQETAPA